MLTKTPLHDQIAEKLAGREPDRFTICAQFVQSRAYEHLQLCMRRKGVPLGNFAGHIAEVHLRVSLEDICSELGVRNRVVFDPIKDGTSSRHFYFSTDKEGKLYATRRDDGRDHAELDEVVLIDNVPTLFEIKIGQNGRPKSKDPHKRGKNYAMSIKRTSHVLAPLNDYFNTQNTSFVYIIPPALIQNTEEERAFRERGGILVPFYENRRDYHDEVERLIPLMNQFEPWHPFKELFKDIILKEKP